MVMKGVLYRLVGILKFSSLTFSVASVFPEFAAFLSGIVASSLIGAFFLGVPLGLIRGRVRPLRGSNVQGILQRALAVSLLAGISVLIVGEILVSPALLMIGNATIVLSTLFLSGTYMSGLIARKLQA
jgi:hypothetical protein